MGRREKVEAVSGQIVATGIWRTVVGKTKAVIEDEALRRLEFVVLIGGGRKGLGCGDRLMDGLLLEAAMGSIVLTGVGDIVSIGSVVPAIDSASVGSAAPDRAETPAKAPLPPSSCLAACLCSFPSTPARGCALVLGTARERDIRTIRVRLIR